MKEIYKKIVFDEIRETLDKFTSKSLYQCPCCEKIIEWDDANYYPDENSYTCPECMHSFDEDALQEITLLDYIEELFLRYKGDRNETNFD